MMITSINIPASNPYYCAIYNDSNCLGVSILKGKRYGLTKSGLDIFGNRSRGVRKSSGAATADSPQRELWEQDALWITCCGAATDIADSKIKVLKDGPYLVEGPIELIGPDGSSFKPAKETVALCRCGSSSVKPFCDGTHKKIEFRAAEKIPVDK